MTQTQTPDIFNDAEVHYYEEGIFIKPTIDLKKYGIKGENYNVPITVVANKKFGLKIIHGLYMYGIIKISYQDLALNKATLMMNKNYNWVVFIPYSNFNPADRMKAIVSPLEELHNEPYGIYSRDDYTFYLDQVYESSHVSFSFGLGVE